MQRIKMMLMAIVAVFAIGAVGASAAQADNHGHITTDLGACDFVFNAGAVLNPDPHSGDGWEWGKDLTDFAVDTGEGKACDAADFDASLHFHKKTDGSAEVVGSITVPAPGFGSCTYGGTLTGTWTWVGTQKKFVLSPSPQSIALTGFTNPVCLLDASVDVSTPTEMYIDWP